jgi:hypothetical protein
MIFSENRIPFFGIKRADKTDSDADLIWRLIFAGPFR